MNFQDSILSALIPRVPAEKYLTDEAFKEISKARVSASYFSSNYRILFDIIVKQQNKQTTLDREILEAYLIQGNYEEEKKNELRILFNTCKEQTVPLEKFIELIPAFVEQSNTLSFGDALTSATRILTEGMQNGKISLKGLTDAKKYLIDKISGLQGSDSASFPQAKVSESMQMLWDIYNEAQNNPGIGVLTGIKEIDAATRGIRKGELWILGGFMGEGKSQGLRNFAYYASAVQKKNVVYATLEMPLRDLLVQFVSLHSTNPKFKNPFGVKSTGIYNGELSKEDLIKLEEVTTDYSNSSQFGINHILQLPFGSTVSSLKEKLVYLNSLFKIDCLYLDYTALLKPEFVKHSTVAETTQVANDLKSMALGFNDGEGLAVVAAHQVSRDARQRAEKAEIKRYDYAFLADSAGVERAADVILWILRTTEMQEQREIKMGVNKFRRGKTIPDFRLREYYDCSKIESMVASVQELGRLDLID